MKGDTIWKIGFSVVLTALLSLNVYFLGGLKGDTKNLKDDGKLADCNILSVVTETKNQLFTHLTNHDIHIPREQIVSKAEFQIYSNTVAETAKDIKKAIDDLRNDIRNINAKNYGN